MSPDNKNINCHCIFINQLWWSVDPWAISQGLLFKESYEGSYRCLHWTGHHALFIVKLKRLISKQKTQGLVSKSWSRGIVSALPTVHVVVAPPCNEVWVTASMVKFFFPNSLVAIPEPARRRKQLQKGKLLMTAAPHSACQLDCDGFLVNRAGTLCIGSSFWSCCESFELWEHWGAKRQKTSWYFGSMAPMYPLFASISIPQKCVLV